MNIKNKLERYIMDKEYKIIIKTNYINIINYIEIKDFTNTLIQIKNENSITKIKGKNLIISKMQDNELLIKGEIDSIEL